MAERIILSIVPDSFADHPKTIGEIRSDRDRDGSKWGPRDVLIELLRSIDQGEIAPDTMFVAFSESVSPGSRRTFFRAAGTDPGITLGTLERAKHNYMSQAIVEED